MSVYQYCNSHQAPEVRSVTVSGLLGYDLNRWRGERSSSYESSWFDSDVLPAVIVDSDNGDLGFKFVKALLTNFLGQLVR